MGSSSEASKGRLAPGLSESPVAWLEDDDAFDVRDQVRCLSSRKQAKLRLNEIVRSRL